MSLSNKLSDIKSKLIERYWVIIFTLLMVFYSYETLAAVTCDAGFISDNFSDADYGKLGSNSPPPTTGADKLLDGIINENYVLAANSFSISGSLDSGGKNTYKSIVTDRVQNFEFFQDFATPETTRTVSYTFKNEFTGQDQELDKVSLSIYDIDSNISYNSTPPYFEFFDEVTIKGFTSLGASVSHTLSSKGTTITDTAPYRQKSTTNDFSCSGLSNNCKVSIVFDKPVAKVDIVYGNNTDLRYYYNNKLNNPGDQLINIVFDGYCYKPQPRLTYKKELSDPRKANTDQFTVQIKDNTDNSVVTNGITTTTTKGTGNTITNGTGTTGIFKINPTKTYTLTEVASDITTLSNYMPIYACRKSGPNGATITTFNPNSLQLTYGDDWTCTVTNGLKPYTFTGFVFNDNGGVLKSNIEPKTKFDVSSKFTSNSSYFNGIFDRSNEVGIGTTSGLSVSLTDCKGNNISTIISNTNPQTNLNSPLGQFKFTVPANAIANLPVKEVCLVQTEPDPWTFSVDTTPNIRKIDLTKNPNRFDYKTDDLLNLDFGEVETDYASLVLVKSQYVNNCDINANYDGTNGTSSQPPSFSTDSITNIEPGKCIAYRIEAYNRGHVDLKDIRISDELQTKAQGGLVNSVFALPAPKGDPTSLYTRTTLPTGTITSELFKLDKPTGAVPTKATLYFNTKYGTTVDP